MSGNLVLCIIGFIFILLGIIIAVISVLPEMHSQNTGMSLACFAVGIAMLVLGAVMVFKLAGLRFYFDSP